MINRVKKPTLSISIYSIEFILVWDDNIHLLEPYLSDSRFIVHINNIILPRYGLTLMNWLKDLHRCSDILTEYFIKDVTMVIVSYLV